MARRVLTIADRIEISTGVKAGWEVRKIARYLGRDPGVISREIRRNRNADGTYRGVGADVKAERRRAPANPEGRSVSGAACARVGRSARVTHPTPDRGTLAPGSRQRER